MKELIEKLNSIEDSYFEFVDSVVDYAKSKKEHFVILTEFMDKNPNASVSDVLEFISDQPDFFEDDVKVKSKVG